jgi:hypothetical protein
VQAAGLVQGLLGVEGEVGGNFEADIAVGAVAGVVDPAQDVGRRLDVCNGDAKGELQALVEKDDLRGVTSNPAIFEKAIGHSAEYDDSLKAVLSQGWPGWR